MLVMLLCSATKSDTYVKLFSLFDSLFPLFLTVFKGSTVRIPNLNTLLRYRSQIKIYTYVSKRGFEEDAYRDAAKFFGRKITHIQAVVAKTQKSLEAFKEIVSSRDTQRDEVDEVAEMFYDIRVSVKERTDLSKSKSKSKSEDEPLPDTFMDEMERSAGSDAELGFKDE